MIVRYHSRKRARVDLRSKEDGRRLTVVDDLWDEAPRLGRPVEELTLLHRHRPVSIPLTKVLDRLRWIELLLLHARRRGEGLTGIERRDLMLDRGDRRWNRALVEAEHNEETAEKQR